MAHTLDTVIIEAVIFLKVICNPLYCLLYKAELCFFFFVLMYDRFDEAKIKMIHCLTIIAVRSETQYAIVYVNENK